MGSIFGKSDNGRWELGLEPGAKARDTVESRCRGTSSGSRCSRFRRGACCVREWICRLERWESRLDWMDKTCTRGNKRRKHKGEEEGDHS
eukprot:scaffold184_cov179-Amphora_coffeaeformis.AAC.9